jgi:hypothetical protein
MYNKVQENEIKWKKVVEMLKWVVGSVTSTLRFSLY